MRKIEISYQNGKFALLVDGTQQPIQDEGDLVGKLIGLGITKERAGDYVADLKRTQQRIKVQ